MINLMLTTAIPANCLSFAVRSAITATAQSQLPVLLYVSYV